jgi:hypothetical protein
MAVQNSIYQVLSNFGKNFVAAVDAAAARVQLGLGSLATQDANAVAITGGSASGLSSVVVSGTTPSVNPQSGALVVAGGLGVGGGIFAAAYNGGTLGSAGGNVFFVWGNAAQRALTTGNSNSAFGSAAQLALTTGSGNSAFGNSAQLALTTGSGNSAFGNTAQLALTTGNWNGAFGNTAQRALTTGSSNSAFGNTAQLALTTGSSNSAFGESAQRALTTGGSNSAFGNSAQRTLTTGQRNTSIGFEATRNGNPSDSVHLGHRAGRDETRSNTFYLSNTETPTPLIYGEFDTRNLSLMGAPKSFGGGSGVLNLPAATTAPTSDPTGNSVLIYVDPGSGRLKIRQTNGVDQFVALSAA